MDGVDKAFTAVVVRLRGRRRCTDGRHSGSEFKEVIGKDVQGAVGVVDDITDHGVGVVVGVFGVETL